MKCRLCYSEWNTSPSISASIKSCPFCGGRLSVPACDFTTEHSVLQHIYERFGCEFMRDGNRVLACFSDLAPSLKKEKRMLAYLFECNGHIQILDALEDFSDMSLVVQRIVQQMSDELFVAEGIAQTIVNSYLQAVKSEMNASPEAVPQTDNEGEQEAPKELIPKPNNDDRVMAEELSYNEEFKITGKTLVKYLGSSSIVRVPDGIRIVGKRAFAENKAIRTVMLPDSVQKIKAEAFKFCSNLQSINFPNDLEEIQDSAFAGSGLKSIMLPSRLGMLGIEAFSYTGIEKVTIPGSVNKVPERAFASCRSLGEVTLCEGVEVLDGDAFTNCPGLRTITIPDSLDTICTRYFEYHMFVGTDNITTVNASEKWKKNHPDYLLSMLPSRNDSENYKIENNVLIRYFGRAVRPVIPEGVRTIGPCAFTQNPHMLGVIIPNGVQYIGERAFALCSNLRGVTLPRSLARIDRSAFAYTGIASLTLPNGVYGIGSKAFENCSRLSEITMPDSLMTVAPDAFDHCKNIQTINASNEWKQKHHDLVVSIMQNRLK